VSIISIIMILVIKSVIDLCYVVNRPFFIYSIFVVISIMGVACNKPVDRNRELNPTDEIVIFPEELIGVIGIAVRDSGTGVEVIMVSSDGIFQTGRMCSISESAMRFLPSLDGYELSICSFGTEEVEDALTVVVTQLEGEKYLRVNTIMKFELTLNSEDFLFEGGLDRASIEYGETLLRLIPTKTETSESAYRESEVRADYEKRLSALEERIASVTERPPAAMPKLTIDCSSSSSGFQFYGLGTNNSWVFKNQVSFNWMNRVSGEWILEMASYRSKERIGEPIVAYYTKVIDNRGWIAVETAYELELSVYAHAHTLANGESSIILKPGRTELELVKKEL